jgi:hypothetical protein
VPEQTTISFGKEQQINHCPHQATEIKHVNKDIDGWPFHANKSDSYAVRRQDYCGSLNVVLLSHSEDRPMGHLPLAKRKAVRPARSKVALESGNVKPHALIYCNADRLFGYRG